MRAQAAALTEAEARATEARAEATEAKEHASQLESDLRASGEREGSLSTLLTSLGYSSLSLNGIDWSVGDAKTLLESEEAAMVELDTLLAKVRSGSVACRAMIGQQESLQQELLRFPVQAA